MRQEIIVNSFTGGGGASEGIKMALASLCSSGLHPEAPEYIAYVITHDDTALGMHTSSPTRTIHLPTMFGRLIRWR